MARSVTSITVLGQQAFLLKSLLDICHDKTHFSSVFIFHMLIIQNYQNVFILYPSQVNYSQTFFKKRASEQVSVIF